MTKEMARLCGKFARIKNKIIIGLTGTVCSGKSAVLGFFRESGAFCVSTDALAKEVLTSGTCYNRILGKFSPGVFLKDGSIDRNKLAQAVFSDKAKRKRLEKILHPEILKQTLSLIEKSHEKLIVVEVPLLFETGLDNCFDIIICVDAPAKQRARRAAGRGWSAGELKAREAAQLPAGDKEKRADMALENGGGLKELKYKVGLIYDFLNAIELEK